ncbi:hypothetical protein VB715_21235 [Crocosphaera sp. UHCC 0190]|uniref:hypothetical protein n=1 Tax=Crocosphaera sp. UHCC 0190 TaxID=3110246 RepID=UPI002B2037F1|nr:hypothetical protein [Crocosphaera sp. UHCC 0190]MEA5512300.1 hypothetical protein [Crocosphaera sp. UHCC 0190]
MTNNKLNHSPKTKRRSPDTQSQEQMNFTEYSSVEKTEITSNPINLPKTALTPLSFWLSKNQGESPKQVSWKTVKHPTTKQIEKGSRQFFFWETLITVGLLVMALWMQTLPTRQLPETMNNKSIQWFEMNDSQKSF